MAKTAAVILAGNVYRRIIDRLTSVIVTAGGLAVLMALLLIVLYLFWVVSPLFKYPHLSFMQRIPIESAAPSLIWGISPNNHLAYNISQRGRLSAFSLQSEPKILLDKLLVDKPITSFFFPITQNGSFALGLASGEVYLQKLIFSEDKQNFSVGVDFETLEKLSVANSAIDELAFARNQALLTVAAISSDRLLLSQWQGDELEYQENLAIAPNSKIQLSSNGKMLYLLSENQLSVYQIDYQKIWLREKINLSEYVAQLATNISLLPNEMLLLALKNGEATLWFDVLKKDKRQLMLQHRFAAAMKVKAIEAGRNVFANLDSDTLTLWHFPTYTEYRIKIRNFTGSANKMAFSPEADSLLIEQDDQVLIYQMNNPHPEINFTSLWQKIWHQGEPKPNFIWQSGVNELEIKASLVPLLFGSIKVTLFTLVISIPIALGGAIYTAHFMPAELRKWIKPIVELMGAFPTVILGFLASLWLAPWLEYHLLTVLFFCILAPLSFFVLAFFSRQLPKKWQKSLTPSKYILLLIILIYFVALIAAMLADWLTLHYRDVSDVLTLNIEQKNTLVVGLALSFAVVPTIFSIAEEAIFFVPQHLSDASIALGATPWQTLSHVVLTTASPGIFCALMMGASRIIGETIIVLMATGNTPITDWNPFIGLRSLAANIAIEMPESLLNSSHFRVLFLTAFLLFCFTFLFNTLAELVRERLSDKYRTL